MGNYITIAIIMLIPYAVFSAVLLGINDFTVLAYVLTYKVIEYLFILPAFTFIYCNISKGSGYICGIKNKAEESRITLDFFNVYVSFPMITTTLIYCTTQRTEQIQYNNLYLIFIIIAMYIVRVTGQAICTILIDKKLWKY